MYLTLALKSVSSYYQYSGLAQLPLRPAPNQNKDYTQQHPFYQMLCKTTWAKESNVCARTVYLCSAH